MIEASEEQSHTSAGRIPRVLHQIYLSGDLPPQLHRTVAELKAANPGWEHRLYDAARAEAFIAAHYGPEMLATYLRLNPDYGAARADFLRYLIMYEEGGVYLDIKSRFILPIDDVILPDDSLVLAQWRNGPGQPHEGWGLHHDIAHVPGGEYQNFHIIAAPGHPVLKAAIDQVVSNIRSYRPWSAVGRTGVQRTTGPIAYTHAVLKAQGLAPVRKVANETLLGIEVSPPGYDHSATFRRHYSVQTSPVVLMGPVSTMLSAGFVHLRRIKAALKR